MEMLKKNPDLVYDYDDVTYKLNQIGMTGLAWACQKNHERIARTLLTAKPNVHMTDLIHRSPLFFAMKAKNVVLVNELLKMRASPWSVKGQPSYEQLCGYDSRICALIRVCRTVDWSNTG